MRAAHILKNATDEQLSPAVQKNLFALFRAMTALPNSYLEETEQLSRHFASPLNPMYKGVWGANLTAPATKTDIPMQFSSPRKWVRPSTSELASV